MFFLLVFFFFPGLKNGHCANGTQDNFSNAPVNLGSKCHKRKNKIGTFVFRIPPGVGGDVLASELWARTVLKDTFIGNGKSITELVIYRAFPGLESGPVHAQHPLCL